MSDRGQALRIGEVAELTGTTTRTIRYYEEIGLLPTTQPRAPGSHRSYEQADVERLRDVLRLKDLLGVSLEELRELAAADVARASPRWEWDGGIEDPARRRKVLSEALGHVELQLELVRRRGADIDGLDRELTAKRRRLQTRLNETQVPGEDA